MDRGAWQAAVHSVAKSQIRLNDSIAHTLDSLKSQLQNSPVMEEQSGENTMLNVNILGIVPVEALTLSLSRPGRPKVRRQTWVTPCALSSGSVTPSKASQPLLRRTCPHPRLQNR